MSTSNRRTTIILVVLVVALFAVLGLCICGWLGIRSLISSQESDEIADPLGPTALAVAYSPEKEETFLQLVSAFNAQVASQEGEVLPIEAASYEPDLMIEAALDGKVQAISPDSWLWLDALDREWMARTGRESPLVGQTARYAVSPIVIAMWEDVAREMGYPEKPLGWADLLSRAAKSDRS